MGRNWQLKPTSKSAAGAGADTTSRDTAKCKAYSLLCGRLCTAPPEVAGDPQFNPSTAHQHLRR